MIKKVERKLERLKLEKEKCIIQKNEIQERIDDIDIEIKKYNTVKKEYTKLEKKFSDLINPEEVKNEQSR